MRLDIGEDSLPVYEALASKTRLEILRQLALGERNIKEMAEILGLSAVIVGKHINQLEAAGLIATRREPGKGGTQKVAKILVEELNVVIAQEQSRGYQYRQEVPIGHYNQFDVTPTCGLATVEDYIGNFDEPKYFMDTHKAEAGILWFTKGFLEYQIPNLLQENQQVVELQLSMELSSEYPGWKSDWPSDITLSLNDVELCTWQSPGDFADRRGKYTPAWWSPEINQYGILLTVDVTDRGIFIGGEKVADVTLADVTADLGDFWKLKLEVKEDAVNVGGLTLFGKAFGDYDQGIVILTSYRPKSISES